MSARRRGSQSLGRQRQCTAPSLKGMPTLDSTAPELTLSSHPDMELDDEYKNLEDLCGLYHATNRGLQAPPVTSMNPPPPPQPPTPPTPTTQPPPPPSFFLYSFFIF